jgi:hypothetical protein
MPTNNKSNVGDNSQQLQAEKYGNSYWHWWNVREKFIKKWTCNYEATTSNEALTIANSRVAELKNKLLPKMEAVDGVLEANV